MGGLSDRPPNPLRVYRLAAAFSGRDIRPAAIAVDKKIVHCELCIDRGRTPTVECFGCFVKKMHPGNNPGA